MHIALLVASMCYAAVLDASEKQANHAFNYAEALQKTLYFFEAQQSGPLSPNNRVEWRGPSCLEDGKDIGKDLSGGWYDAGDHWTANLTMSFAAMTLAWAAIEHPEGWIQTGQMDELLESLVYVNRYFLKCVLNPDVPDPARNLDIAIGCGGREGVPDPNVHSMWGPAEVAHLMTRRPTFRVNKECPAGDIPGAMASAMASSAMVIRSNGHLLKGKQGYDDFDPSAFSNTLLDRAEKLTLFARANMGPVMTQKMSNPEKEAINRQRSRALRSDGVIVETGYRSGPADKVFAAATWLARAAVRTEERRRWQEMAEEIYEGLYKEEFYNDYWKDYGAGNFGKVGAYNMLRLEPECEKYHAELQLYSHAFTTYKTTPGGLRLREWFAHEYGSLRHANNAAVVALYYSDLVEKAPVLKGNTWWKGSKSNLELKELFRREAKRQVDYALGDNPYQRSYLVGFGSRPFINVHHRGAYGAWAGFEHFIQGKADDRPVSRHILYGALVAGPDHNDVFLCGREHLKWMAGPGASNQEFFYQFPNRSEPIRKEGYSWNAADEPVQDVMDSTYNEVALDYNAGFTASLAWLCASGLSAGSALPDTDFPSREKRNDNTDLKTTDREYFASAREIKSSHAGIEIETTLNNRSRWPSRTASELSLRYYFTLEGETRTEQVQASISGSDTAKLTGPVRLSNNQAYVEVAFLGKVIHPGSLQAGRRAIVIRLSAPEWNSDNDWSHEGMCADTRLLPNITVHEKSRLIGGNPPVIATTQK